jgi:penicillin-binding protein 1C
MWAASCGKGLIHLRSSTMTLHLAFSHRIITSIVLVSFALVATFFALSLLFPLPSPRPYSLLIKDRNGKFLRAFLADDDAWRLKTSPDEIPERLKRILIEKEDKYFFYHPGINPFSICRAMVQNITTGKRISGASTLTMQIARMLERRERTYFSKTVEMFRALQLEWKYSKAELLEIYLSIIPLGGNIEGLKSAAHQYYQTPLERLNVAQLFDLILIPNDPNNLAPNRNPERLLEERKKRALPWIANGFFSRQDSIIIWNTDARAIRRPLKSHAPHFCLRVKSQMREASEVRSSLDLNTQKSVEVLLSNHLRHWKLVGVQNGAVIVLDNSSREILAYAGSENFEDTSAHGQVDAAKALRSPGSTLKPFLFALQMEQGLLTPKTRLLDTPYDAEGFQAENYDGMYSGTVYADEALRRSLNVPMVRLLHQAGVRPFVDFTANAGIASLSAQRDKLGLSLILGGCGVSLEELVGAYSTFPAGGTYGRPSFVHQDKLDTSQERTAFSASTAFMITEILAGLDRPDLPNNFESSVNLPKIAFKTGTSYGRRDAWTIGYSAEYTIGVWIGNVDNKGNPELVGGKSAAPLLVDIFNSISSGHQKNILPMPRDVGFRDVCTKSGLLPSLRCDHVIEDYYSVSRTLPKTCEVDKEFLVSNDGRRTFCSSCVGENKYKVVTYPDYPSELLSFWSKTGVAFQQAPLHNASCTRSFSGNGPTIVSPTDEMTYYMVSPKQKVTLQASSGLDVNEHIWYLDDAYLGRNKPGDKFFISLHGGEHRVSCLDDKGRISSVHITVRAAL